VLGEIDDVHAERADGALRRFDLAGEGLLEGEDGRLGGGGPGAFRRRGDRRRAQEGGEAGGDGEVPGQNLANRKLALRFERPDEGPEGNSTGFGAAAAAFRRGAAYFPRPSIEWPE
jgi:hypothetical protein